MNFKSFDFTKSKILVVGDVMLDRYWTGQTSRISPEAPVPIVHHQQTRDVPGGAGNVAVNAASLGAQVVLRAIVGEDDAAQQLQGLLKEHQVKAELIIVPTYQTITKLRILSQHQQLIRLDFEQNKQLIPSQEISTAFKAQLSNFDIVILSDYAKGIQRYAKSMIEACRQLNIPIFIDPKGNDFSYYEGATLLTPNLKEFEAVVGPCQNEAIIHEKGLGLINALNLNALLVTQGEQGLTLLQGDGSVKHFHAQARDVYDVTGAGDTVIACMATAYAQAKEFISAAQLANKAAGIVVGKLGTSTVTAKELAIALNSVELERTGIVDENELMLSVNRARQSGQTIVMTNGCFDLLHLGHLEYLAEAKSLGHRLIVAVNSDDSVKNLKGPTRPLHKLTERMKMLAQLKSVDWVVSFNEATPERLITKIMPDVLVKGGDYQVSEIAGASAVLQNGGEVKVLNFLTGYSTTQLIKRIQSMES